MMARALEIIFSLVSLLAFLLILISPFVVSRKFKSKNYFELLFITILTTFIFSLFFTYWSEVLSDKLIYTIFGFNEDGMSDLERLQNVSLVNRQTIAYIYEHSFGIGWPLQLIMLYIFMVLPYSLIICTIIYNKRKKHSP